MVIFGGKKARATRLEFKRGEDRATSADAKQLALMDGLFDLARPQSWRQFWYCATQDGATGAATRMRADGWHVDRIGRAVEGTGWAIVADRDDLVVTSAAVSNARTFFVALAAQAAGGEYDGWELRTTSGH